VLNAFQPEPRYEEYRAAGAIKPGHCIQRNSDNAVVVQATAKADEERIVAIEQSLLGLDITTAYASGDLVRCVYPQRSHILLLRVAAAASAIVIGDDLEFAGDGTVRKFTDGVKIGTAEEAVDNSAGGSEAFIRVKFR
jgi:hypothetical protein